MGLNAPRSQLGAGLFPPFYQPGKGYFPPLAARAATLTSLQDRRPHYTPYFVRPGGATLDRVRIHTLLGGSAKFALYSDNNGRPGAIIVPQQEVTPSGVGSVEIDLTTNLALEGGEGGAFVWCYGLASANGVIAGIGAEETASSIYGSPQETVTHAHGGIGYFLSSDVDYGTTNAADNPDLSTYSRYTGFIAAEFVFA